MKTKGRPIYIFSDLHWEHPKVDVGQFDATVDRIEDENAWIVLAGDIFDAWMRSPEYCHEHYYSRMARIRERVLLYVPGNHDGDMRHEMWVPWPMVYPWHKIEIDGRWWFITHGHLFGRYKAIFMVTDWIDNTRVFRKVTRYIVKRNCLKLSGRNSSDKQFISEVVNKALKSGCHVAVAGHTHIQSVQDVGPCKFVNPGTAEGGLTWIKYQDGEFTAEAFV